VARSAASSRRRQAGEPHVDAELKQPVRIVIAQRVSELDERRILVSR